MNIKRKKKILIVGGAGYIGSYINKILTLQNYDTIILDNLESGDIRTLKGGIFYEGDFGEQEILKKIFTEHSIDAVMHFAAYIDIGESMNHPLKYYSTNLLKTCTLLETMILHGIKSFIFSSSAAIFGFPNQEKICENHSMSPISPYGRTKKMIEDILKDYHQAYDLNYCCLRYFNAAGGDPDKEIKYYQKKPYNLIPKAILSLFSNNPITIFGTDYPTNDGSCIRDYIHIHDLAMAHLYAMENLFVHGGTHAFNLGNENGFSVREILKTIEKITGKKFTILEGSRRIGDPPKLVADATKAKKILNWVPNYTSIDEIIDHALQSMI